jgi:hypothetical protein
MTRTSMKALKEKSPRRGRGLAYSRNLLVTFMLPHRIVVLRQRRFWCIRPIDRGPRNLGHFFGSSQAAVLVYAVR